MPRTRTGFSSSATKIGSCLGPRVLQRSQNQWETARYGSLVSSIQTPRRCDCDALPGMREPAQRTTTARTFRVRNDPWGQNTNLPKGRLPIRNRIRGSQGYPSRDGRNRRGEEIGCSNQIIVIISSSSTRLRYSIHSCQLPILLASLSSSKRTMSIANFYVENGIDPTNPSSFDNWMSSQHDEDELYFDQNAAPRSEPSWWPLKESKLHHMAETCCGDICRISHLTSRVRRSRELIIVTILKCNSFEGNLD